LLTSRRGIVAGKEKPKQDAEKDEPNDLMFSMAKGRRCKHVSEKTLAQMQVEYHVDTTLGHIVMKTVGAVPPKTMVCPVTSIADIYTVNDGADCFPRRILDLLTPKEKLGLFMIVHTTDNPFAEVGRFFLVEDSESARDSLLEQLQKLTHR